MKKRIIMYTGKGGVGKTSLSAATGLRCAELGQRTIIMSTDSAHSLADSLDRSIGPEPVTIAPNLSAQEIDVTYMMGRYWGKVQSYLSSVFAWQGMDEIMAEETSVLPGMEELASLMQIMYLYETNEYDTVIVDMAPTGATLQLLSFPEMARWYIDKIFPIERAAVRVARPFLKAIVDVPLPDEAVFETVQGLVKDLLKMKALLTDPEITTVRIVLNPEKMVIKEAQRAYTYLNMYGYAVDAVISNRILPSFLSEQYFQTWKEIQAKYGVMVEEAFSPLPIFQVPMFEQEVVGPEILLRMAHAVYGDRNPADVFYHGQAQEIRKEGDQYKLRLHLPFLNKQDIHVTRAGDELVLHVGNWKRNLALPHALLNLDVLSARYDNEYLVVTFGTKEAVKLAS